MVALGGWLVLKEKMSFAGVLKGRSLRGGSVGIGSKKAIYGHGKGKRSKEQGHRWPGNGSGDEDGEEGQGHPASKRGEQSCLKMDLAAQVGGGNLQADVGFLTGGI